MRMATVHKRPAAATSPKLCAAMIALAIWAAAAPAEEPTALPGTNTLDWQGDLSERMMHGLHRFVERKIDASVGERPKLWRRDFTSIAAYEKSIEPNRQRLRRITGVVDPRIPVRMERFGDDDNPALVARTERFCVYQVRWPVLVGVYGEGLLLQPNDKPLACVVALPDADQTPEQIVGLSPGVPADAQFGRRLVEAGLQVVVPMLVDRSDQWSGSPDVAWTNQTHREWIYRQAYHMGRHVIGYEVQKVLAAVDWFKARAGKDVKIGVMGHGEGGLLALYAAACDTRIDACLTSGYFQPRQRVWTEPLYRNVWSLLTEFGDAELATLIAPRGLIVEHSEVPTVADPPPVRQGRRGGAAAGQITTPQYTAVAEEFARIGSLLHPGFQVRHLVTGPNNRPAGPGSEPALKLFLNMLGSQVPPAPPGDVVRDERRKSDPAERQRRQVKELEDHVQRLLRTADRTRDQFFFSKVAPDADEQHRRWTTARRVKTFPAEPFIERTRPYRRYFREEVLGKFDDPLLPPGPRSRKVYDRPQWTGYEYVLDVYPDVFAWGVLLLPKDLKPGEKRPVVVCQHGRGGVPKDVIEGNNTAYNDFAARLADRGFIVVAPHNPYRGEDRYRDLSRKANAVKASLFSFILSQHEQLLNWLQTLPSVDPQRIAFYGLSYGGETAVRAPTVLERYCLSICSGDFNDWARKVAATDSRYSFMFTVEWEMPYFDMGSTFNYAEMAYLMVPRPFMVERGHSDNVAPDEWVAYEYAKVRRMYDELDLGDRTEIEFFPGGHSINGQRTFQFLERHLRWPTPPAGKTNESETKP